MNSREMPFVSIIVPCRNEESYIGKCLDSILRMDYPRHMLEVLIIDGMSDDSTVKIVETYIDKWPFIKLFNNAKKIVPSAMNIGIQNAKGEVIIRMDAHASYEESYVAKCVKYLMEYEVDNVGGIFITRPGDHTLIAESIAIALSSSFGVGNAHFRLEPNEPKYVDTVPYGCYRKDIFRKVGLFDEELIRNQDDELNLRIVRSGGKILLMPDIRIYYYSRETILKLWRMYFQYGYFKPLVAKKVGVVSLRQLAPAALITGLIVSGFISFISETYWWLSFSLPALYSFVNLTSSFYLAAKRGVKYLLVLPVVFMTVHFSYGFGYMKGVWDFIIRRKKCKEVPLSR